MGNNKDYGGSDELWENGDLGRDKICGIEKKCMNCEMVGQWINNKFGEMEGTYVIVGETKNHVRR